MAVDGGAPALAQQSVPSVCQSTTDMKLDEVIAALVAQKDESRAASTQLQTLTKQLAIMEDRLTKIGTAMQQLQDALSQLNLDLRVAALEVAVRDGTGVGRGTGATAPDPSASVAPPVKKARGPGARRLRRRVRPVA